MDETLDAIELKERINELELDERIEELELITDDEERGDEDDERTDDGTLDETILDDTDEADEPAGLQIAPVTIGVSTAPLVLTCNPKDTVCPGCTVPFQLILDAL